MSEIVFNNLKSFDGFVSEKEFNSLVDALRSIAINPGIGYTVTRNATGTVITTKPGTSSVAETCPFTIQLTKDPTSGTKKLSLSAGLVNLKLPHNIFDKLTYEETGTQYVKLSCDTDGKNVTGITIVVDSSPPDALSATMGEAQDNFDVLMYVIVNGSPFRVWTCGNVYASVIEATRQQKASVSPGSPAFDIYYTWEVQPA